MNHYMVEFEIPEDVNDDIILIIPSQRTKINELMAKGIVLSYSLSINNGKLWVLLSVKNSRKATEIINSFPVSKYLIYTINELIIHESGQSKKAPPLCYN